MENNLEVEIIRHYLIENKKEFNNTEVIKWINLYWKDFRDIIEEWNKDINIIKEKLYEWKKN